MTESSTDAVPDEAFYLYCLARPECQAAAMFQEPAAILPGIDASEPARALHLERVAVTAVVSRVRPSDFSDSNLVDFNWLGPRARAHESVVHQVMRHSTVLPVKFGTIFRSEASLTAFVVANGVAIVRALHELHGKAEWGVKAFIDEKLARSHLSDSDPEIQKRLAALAASPGLRYMQQKQVDQLIETRLQKWIATLAEELRAALEPRALAVKPLRLHTSAVSGRAETMIHNSAFLLNNQQSEELENALVSLHDAHATAGVSFELQGPWPPFNFCPTLATVS